MAGVVNAVSGGVATVGVTSGGVATVGVTKDTQVLNAMAPPRMGRN